MNAKEPESISHKNVETETSLFCRLSQYPYASIINIVLQYIFADAFFFKFLKRKMCFPCTFQKT